MFLLFLALFFNCGMQGQVTNSTNGIFITLSSDLLDADLYYTQKMSITSNQNITLSGRFVSESVLISPMAPYTILITPRSGSSYLARDGGGSDGTTVVKSKGTAVGRPMPPLTVYPNPVQTNLNFNTPNNLATGYSIYDLNGTVLQSSSFPQTDSGTINVSALASGNYILRIEFIDYQYATIQFIKN